MYAKKDTQFQLTESMNSFTILCQEKECILQKGIKGGRHAKKSKKPQDLKKS